MTWQQEALHELVARLPPAASCDVVGSAADPTLVDGWSDLDLHLRLPHPVPLFDLLGPAGLWAVEFANPAEGQVVRTVLSDGRRIDLLVETGRLLLPPVPGDNDVRFLAALAAARLGRGDRLVGGHLVLELLRACLVQAMLLRDRDEGTNVHRAGGARDGDATQVTRLAQGPWSVRPRPNVVEGAVELYGRWRGELEEEYQPDWSGLEAVLSRGLS